MKKNRFIVIVDNVFGVSGGQKLALMKCIHENVFLHREFMDTRYERNMSTDRYREVVRDFIEAKGLTIVDEKPVARVKGDRYVVDVHYTITW